MPDPYGENKGSTKTVLVMVKKSAPMYIKAVVSWYKNEALKLYKKVMLVVFHRC